MGFFEFVKNNINQIEFRVIFSSWIVLQNREIDCIAFYISHFLKEIAFQIALKSGHLFWKRHTIAKPVGETQSHTHLPLERKLQFTEFLLMLFLSFLSHQTSTDWWEFSVIILTMSLETLVCAMKHDWQFYFQWILYSKGGGVSMEVFFAWIT